MDQRYILPPKERVCCFTGHRDLSKDEFLQIRPILQETIEKLFLQGVDTFIVGGAVGFDTMAATEVLNLQRKLYPGMKLVLAIPCEGQDRGWSPIQRALYQQIRQLATAEVVLSPQYYQGCMLRRNDFMVENSRYLIAYVNRASGGSAYTLRMAKKNRLTICNLADNLLYPPLHFIGEQGEFENI